MFRKFFAWIVLGFNLYDIGETYLDSRYIRLGLHVSKEILISNMYNVYREYINHPHTSYTKKFITLRKRKAKIRIICVRIRNLFTGCRTNIKRFLKINR